MSADLFEPFQLGDLTLANRMVMAPMTRNRADENGVVAPMTVTYYRQRASAGLSLPSPPRSHQMAWAIPSPRGFTLMPRRQAGSA